MIYRAQHSTCPCLLKSAAMRIPNSSRNNHLLVTVGHYRQAGSYTGSWGTLVWVEGESWYCLEDSKGTVGICRAWSVILQVSESCILEVCWGRCRGRHYDGARCRKSNKESISDVERGDTSIKNGETPNEDGCRLRTMAVFLLSVEIQKSSSSWTCLMSATKPREADPPPELVVGLLL